MTKDEKFLAIRINREVAEKLKQYCKEKDLSITQLIRRLIDKELGAIKWINW